MTRKPPDPSSREAPAVDDVRTKKEADAEAEKRHAETELSKAGRSGDASPSVHGHVKKHEREDLDAVQSSSDEPIIEDEP